jgi:hypothetical protein
MVLVRILMSNSGFKDKVLIKLIVYHIIEIIIIIEIVGGQRTEASFSLSALS